MVKYKIYHALSLDPRENLALEESLMAEVKENECIILFWQSENAVVIGVNQNPYQECNISQLEKDHVTMVRRLSGGGAVYHDLGNLNFAFIARTDTFNVEHNFEIILEALKTLGVEGEFNGRNDLSTLGRKFSGNAFIHEEDFHLHHGTLLLNADVTKISNYLTVSHKKLDNKGFDSIRSRVVNLTEINPDITVEGVIDATIKLLKSKDLFHSFKAINDQLTQTHFQEKYASHEWNFGACPPFDLMVEEKFHWGLVNLEMNIDGGNIKNLHLRTDALDYNLFSQLNNGLKAIKLTQSNIEKVLKATCQDLEIQEDLLKLFQQHLFE